MNAASTPRATIPADAHGVYPIAPTPFHDDGRIDLASIDRLTDFYLGCGATGITVLGQLGEAPKLEHGESVEVAAPHDPPRRRAAGDRRRLGAGLRRDAGADARGDGSSARPA